MNESKRKMVIVAGPTAVGKSEAAVLLSKEIGGEVVSADSMQIYRGMDIGTAKITEEEMQGVPHHLIDCVKPDVSYNVSLFKEMAYRACEGIWERGAIPVICGGTGFYIQSLAYDIDFTEDEVDEEYRSRLWQLADERGSEYLHGLLLKVDPASAEAIHANNKKRVIRALEYHHLTGEKISEHNAKERDKTSPYELSFFVLTDDRQRLYERIDSRVDAMMAAGLLDEVKELKKLDIPRSSTAMQGIGYKQLLDYLDGECSLEEAVLRIKTESRHYAKRQLTWFRRERDVIWISREDYPETEAIVRKMIRYV